MADREKIFEAFGALDSPRVAHYSEGLYPVVPGVPVTLSGIVGKDISTGKLVPGGAGPEAQRILDEIQRQLERISLGVRHVMHVRVMLAGHVGNTGEPSEDFKAMNEVYREIFKNNDPPPTRDTIGGCQLLDGARVEIVATAWKPNPIVKQKQ